MHFAATTTIAETRETSISAAITSSYISTSDQSILTTIRTTEITTTATPQKPTTKPVVAGILSTTRKLISTTADPDPNNVSNISFWVSMLPLRSRMIRKTNSL